MILCISNKLNIWDSFSNAERFDLRQTSDLRFDLSQISDKSLTLPPGSYINLGKSYSFSYFINSACLQDERSI